jgi:hypothetical protein
MEGFWQRSYHLQNMKAEMINLLDRLALMPDFQNLIVHRNGSSKAVCRHGATLFADLAALEAFCYPDSAAGPVVEHGLLRVKEEAPETGKGVVTGASGGNGDEQKGGS